MIEEIRSTAISVTSKVFETMFFIPLDIGGESGEAERSVSKSSVVFRGEMGFQGKYSGRMRLYLPSDLAMMMAGNFLGLEEGTPSEFQTTDMVNELCNMVCGNLCAELDRKTVWDITLPLTRSISSEEVEREGGEGSGMTFDFVADGYGVKLVIQLET